MSSSVPFNPSNVLKDIAAKSFSYLLCEYGFTIQMTSDSKCEFRSEYLAIAVRYDLRSAELETVCADPARRDAIHYGLGELAIAAGDDNGVCYRPHVVRTAAEAALALQKDAQELHRLLPSIRDGRNSLFGQLAEIRAAGSLEAEQRFGLSQSEPQIIKLNNARHAFAIGNYAKAAEEYHLALSLGAQPSILDQSRMKILTTHLQRTPSQI